MSRAKFKSDMKFLKNEVCKFSRNSFSYKETLTRRGMKEIQKYVCQPVDLQEIYKYIIINTDVLKSTGLQQILVTYSKEAVLKQLCTELEASMIL